MLTKVQSFAASWLIALATTASAAEPAKPEAATATEQKAAAPAIKRGDLRAPDVTKLFTQRELAAVLARTADPNDLSLEEVEVPGTRIRRAAPRSPNVWPGIAAPVWAILNPTQAWRIIAPLPPDQAEEFRLGPEATPIPLTTRSIPKIGEQ